jgi:Asp-tRNA(Asn)/Glu-tRNA(Gln) amidotransferase A subunit family amidase
VIRPASFCGVYGFKPTFGSISRKGVLPGSENFDTLGVFARNVEDCGLLAEVLMRHDPADPAMRLQTAPPLTRVASEEPPVPPRFAFVPTAYWDRAEDSTQEAFRELISVLEGAAVEVELGKSYDDVAEHHRRIMVADLAKNLAPFYERGRDQLTEVLRGMIEEGQKVLAVDYNRSVERIALLRSGFEELFGEFDAIITPAAPGEAPPSLETTGDPIFCTLWTYCGLPAISLPLLQGPKGLPLGVQVVGPFRDDARLLRNARWLAQRVNATLEELEDA